MPRLPGARRPGGPLWRIGPNPGRGRGSSATGCSARSRTSPPRSRGGLAVRRGLTDVDLVAGAVYDAQPHAAQHRLTRSGVRDPPVGRVAGEPLLHEVQAWEAIIEEDVA